MAQASPIVQAAGLSKNFGKLVAVRDLSLNIAAGEVFGFLGPNGAGKTTTIRMLIGGYSHGMRQKLALAGAMLHEPQVLFLDEPTSGLDPRSARLVKDLLLGLVERGHTVFLSTHVLEIAEQLCHRVGIIDHSQIIATGTLEDLRHQSQRESGSLEDIFLQLTGASGERDVAAYLRDS